MTQMIQQRSTALEWSVEIFTGGLELISRRQPHPLVQMWIKTQICLVCMKDLSMHHLLEYINQDIKKR